MESGGKLIGNAIFSGETSQNLMLDSSIRDWVVLPLLVIMITAGLLRHYLGQLLRAGGKSIPAIEGRAKGCLSRSARLRAGGGWFISASKWEGRRRYVSDRENGYLREEALWAEEEKESAGNGESGGGMPGMDPSNPMAAMDGMKGQMAAMVQNMVMMQGISHFFRGYVLVKVPFPLTNGFKMMFQRGLDLSTLDTSYVSSVSWYFLVMFGLRAFFRLAIGEPSQAHRESAMTQHNLGLALNAPPGPSQFDAPKALRTEADNIEIFVFPTKSTLDEAEKRLLGTKYPKRKFFKGSGLSANADIFGVSAKAKSSIKKKKV
uniref:ER membrane protein complex subunit 3 n=1 Tax=Ditylum brightwellii TaxID=49249 RepID=A0A7S4QZ46_9STRA